jgi:hypothetical protein
MSGIPEDQSRYEFSSDTDAKELRTNKEKVAYILNRFPDTRNSDKVLWVKYLELFHEINPSTTFLEAITSGDLPPQTVVARSRAELQNVYSMYLPTRPDIVVKRQGRRKAFERVFQNLDSVLDEPLRQTSVYTDESGLTDSYLLIGFFLTVNGRDAFKVVQQILEWKMTGKKPYFHFKDLKKNQVEDFLRFFKTAIEIPSARAYIHIFDRARLLGEEKQILCDLYGISAIDTLRSLQGGGLIDEEHKFELIMDRSQDQRFYRKLENDLEPKLLQRRIGFYGVTDVDSKDNYLVQTADVIVGAFNRAINSPGANAKDELSQHILGYWGIKNPLKSQERGNLTIVNHSSPKS